MARRLTIALSTLQRAAVVDQDGTRLGSLMDLRCRLVNDAGAGASAAVGGIVFGRTGWLERVGLRRPASDEAQWNDVVRIGDGTIVVRRRA